MAKLDSFSLDNLLDISKPMTVCVALSGGRDSVALLHCLKQFEKRKNYDSSKLSQGCGIKSNDCKCGAQGCDIKNDSKAPAHSGKAGLHIVAVNIEHGIRGESSVRDSRFVAELCEQMKVELYSFSVDAPAFAKQNGYTLEQAARILRYRCFDELLDSGKCDYVALAHHLDDQIETVFMRILRGTGIHGLSGIKAVNGRYIRPLLDYTRDDINEYVLEHNLTYVEDETNDDAGYTRNFLRQEIAVLKQRFPALGVAVKRLCDNAAEADAFIEAQVPDIEVKGDVAYVKTADCENKVVAKRLIVRAASRLGVLQDIEERHLSLVLDLLRADSGKHLDLTHGLSVYKEGDRLAFALRKDEKSEDILFSEVVLGCEGYFNSDGEFVSVGVKVKSVTVDYAKSKIGNGATLYVDSDKIPSGAVVRERRDGDYIHKFGGGTKSLGDFLTDKKVPLRTRDSLKVLADGSQILAVFGVDISADVKLDENTKRVYELSTL